MTTNSDHAPPAREAFEAMIGDSHAVIDLAAAEHAARDLLRALGVSDEDPATRDTARWMVGAYADLFSSRPFVVTTFPPAGSGAPDHPGGGPSL